MSDTNGSLPDDEIGRLITDEPAEVLSAEQRQRLRLRLGLETYAAHDDPTDIDQRRVQDISAPAAIGRPAWARAVALAAAAAVVLVVGVIGIVTLSDDRGVRGDELRVADSSDVAAPVSPTVDPATAPPEARICREEIESFTSGIATWAGVENWAFLTDRRRPAPDLLTLAAAAVGAVDEISDSPDIDDIGTRLDELLRDADIVAGPDEPFELSRPEREAYREAVERAADVIAETVEREGWGDLSGCS